jgi:predicted histidine transporter YuiF (NhaC family)
MHHAIVFTPEDVIQIVHTICTMVGELSVVVGALIAFFAWMKKPKEKRLAELADHEQRIKSLEEKCDDYKTFFNTSPTV